MRLVEALIVRDEADIVGAQIAYHLNAGIDFVIAMDHDSRDGTTEILESYARQGYLRRIPVQGEVLEVEWRTRMARLAAIEHAADWVLAADADEFWMPRRGTIKDVLAAVPSRFGVVGVAICHFAPRPDDGESFAERMTVRLSQQAPVNDPTSPWRPSPKAVHRADPDVQVLHAAYWLESDWLVPLPGWSPFDVFHFPCRSLEQWARKTARRGHVDADKPLGQYVKGLQAQEGGRIEDVYEALVVQDSTLDHGLDMGSLVVDTRLRDALRSLPAEKGGSVPIDLHEAEPSGSVFVVGKVNEPPVDAFSLNEATLVRLQRRVDDAGAQVHGLERRSSVPGLESTRRRLRRMVAR